MAQAQAQTIPIPIMSSAYIDLTTYLSISKSGLTFEVPIMIHHDRIIVCKWMRIISIYVLKIMSPRYAKISRNLWRSLISILLIHKYYDHLRAMGKHPYTLLYDESNDAQAYIETKYDVGKIGMDVALHMIHHTKYMIIDSYEYDIIPNSAIVAYEPLCILNLDDILRQYRESEHFD